MERQWIHAPDERKCECEFPRVMLAFPEECRNCMKLLPEVTEREIYEDNQALKRAAEIQ